ncbi:MAG: hypothetical protein WC275_03250 [Bacilli bacterium]
MDLWLIITLSVISVILFSVLIFTVSMLSPKNKKERSSKAKEVKLEYVNERQEVIKKDRRLVGFLMANKKVIPTLLVISIAAIILEIVFLHKTFAVWQLVFLTTGTLFTIFSLSGIRNFEEKVIRGFLLLIGIVLIVSALFPLGLQTPKLFFYLLGIPAVILLLYAFFNFLKYVSPMFAVVASFLGSLFLGALSLISLILFGGVVFIIVGAILSVITIIFIAYAVFSLVGRLINY